MIKKLFLIILLGSFSSNLSAQLRGKVIDSKTGEPIKGASIKSNSITITDENGAFQIASDSIFTISATGYETLIFKRQKGDVTVALQPTVMLLSDVTVNAFQSKRSLLTVAAPITVLTEKDLNRSDNTTLIPVLNAVPGVKLDYYTYGDYRLNIRGGSLAQPSVHSNGYRMYWNEIPISTASGGSPLGGLDINFIDQLEIIKGPGSSMYGAGFGGALLVNTERAEKYGTFLNSDIMIGNYKTFRSTQGVKSNWNKGNIAIQYSHTESDGFRPMSNMNSNVYNLFGQIYTSSKGTLNYLFNYESRIMNVAGDLDSATFATNPTSFNTVMPTGFGPDKWTLGIGYQHRINNTWSYSIGSNFQDNKGVFVMSFPFFSIFDKEPSTALNNRLVVSNKRTIKNVTIKSSAGLEWGLAKNKGISYDGDFTTDTASITNINDANTKQFLMFAQTELQLPDGWYVTGGISYNSYRYHIKSGINTTTPILYSTTVSSLAPRVSVLKKIKNISFYAALGQGFSPPAAGISNDFLNFDGSVNENLKASSGWNIEVGSRGNLINGLMFYDLTYYHLNIKNAIINRFLEISPGVNVERKTNAGKVLQKGFEALLGFNLAKDKNSYWNGSQLRFGYTYNDYKYADYQTIKSHFDPLTFTTIYTPVDYSGQVIPGTFKHSTITMLDINTNIGLYLNSTLNTYSDTYLTDNNTSKADSYNLLNIRVGYKASISNKLLIIHPYLGINNVGNTLFSSLTAYNSSFGGFFNPGYRRHIFGGIQLNVKLSKNNP